jgi:hypothetical protein
MRVGLDAPDLPTHATRCHGAPKPVLHPGDLDGDLVQAPLVAGLRQQPPDPVGEGPAELERPPPDGLVADDEATHGQHLFGHARRPSGKRKQSQTAWLMASAGTRCSA